MTQFEIFAGIDWSTATHKVAVVEVDGEILGERSFAHSGDGLATMADWILGHGPEGKVAAAIEKPHGPEVDALLERGAAAYALNPKQLDSFRDRLSPAGAKDERRDAFVLADSLATNRKAFRELDAPSPEIIVDAEVKFSKSAEAEFPSFWCFGDEPVQSSNRISFSVRLCFLGGGGMIGAFARTCSGVRSACFRSR